MAKRWRIHPHDPYRIAALQRAAGIPAVVAQLLICRGITDPLLARQFLDPKLSHLRDPEHLPGCSLAAERIHQAISAGRRSIMAFQICLDSSYPSWPGVRSSPRRPEANSSTSEALMAELAAILSAEGYYERALDACTAYARQLARILVLRGGTKGSIVDVQRAFGEAFPDLYYYPSHRLLMRLGLAYPVESATRPYYLLPEGLAEARSRYERRAQGERARAAGTGSVGDGSGLGRPCE